MNKTALLRFALFIQGAFYTITALWALLDLESFFAFVKNPDSPFKTHANAALFLALGIFFLYGSFKEQHRRLLGALAATTSLLIALVDTYYFATRQTSYLFLFDAVEELAIFLLLVFSLLSPKTINTTQAP